MTDPFADRQSPHDAHAEAALIGGILRDPDVLPAVQERLTGADEFYIDAHQRVYRGIEELVITDRPVELAALFGLLRARKQVDDAGGAAYLAGLYESAATGANAEYHAGVVHDFAVVRGLIHAATEIIRDAYDREQSATEQVAAAERRVFAIAQGGIGGADCWAPAAAVFPAALNRIEDRMAAGGRLAGVATGFPDLDDMLGGLKPGELTVLAARPSVGKTAIALNIARNAAEQGVPVAVFSLEQGEDEVACRMLSTASSVQLNHLIRGRRLDDGQVARLVEAGRGLGRTGLIFDTRVDLSAAQIAAATRRAVRRHGVGLVVIDYLQLMRPANPKENRTQQVGQLARDVKHIARACNLPVLCLAQLNRGVEGRQDHEPRLSDLRDSGEIEQHADNVLLLHRRPGQPPEAEVWSIDVKVEKQRNGPTGPVTLAYRRPVVRFESAAPGEPL